MAVPYTFANATTSIPLSQLDSNFATTTTFGNTAVTLGDTVTTLNNMTLANATVSSGNVTITSATVSGNLTFTGTSNRIVGDFSNATLANRVAFQTSTVNGNTGISVLPNGTSLNANFAVVNNSDPTNASYMQIRVGSTTSDLNASIFGTGTYLPMVFLTGGSERVRIDTSGNVGIGTSSPNVSAILDAQSTTKGVRFPNMTTTQKNAVATPPAGLVVFDTTLSKLCVYSGVAWQTITSV
jgi:hypothetical protein